MTLVPALSIQRTSRAWQDADSKVCAERTCGVVIYRQPRTTDQTWDNILFHTPDCERRAADRLRPRTPKVTGDDWRHQAVCRNEDPELFFPIGTSGPALQQIAEARTVCRRCPVVSACLKWALESGQEAGVAGGMSEDERRSLRRRQARTGARTA